MIDTTPYLRRSRLLLRRYWRDRGVPSTAFTRSTCKSLSCTAADHGVIGACRQAEGRRPSGVFVAIGQSIIAPRRSGEHTSIGWYSPESTPRALAGLLFALRLKSPCKWLGNGGLRRCRA